MINKRMFFSSAVALICVAPAGTFAVGGLGASGASDVPRDEKVEKGAAQQKAVKEFAAKVATAIGKQDLDTLIEISDVPWCHDLNTFSENKKDLRKGLENSLEGKPIFDAKCRVRRVETFKAAQATLHEAATKSYKKNLLDDDLIIHMEVDYPKDNKVQIRLLVKMKDGNPRLVGFDEETRD